MTNKEKVIENFRIAVIGLGYVELSLVDNRVKSVITQENSKDLVTSIIQRIY